jgi:transposase
MPKAFPKEFRRDVVEVARKREAPVSQVARDFGISESCLHRWLQQADIEDGVREGALPESAEMRELKKRNRLLEQENEILRRAAAFFAKDVLPK